MHLLVGPSGAERLGGRRPFGGCRYRVCRPWAREDLTTYAGQMKGGGIIVSIPVEPDTVDVVHRVVGLPGGRGMTHHGKGRRVQPGPWADKAEKGDEPKPPQGPGAG